jgi:hypothetical protein
VYPEDYRGCGGGVLKITLKELRALAKTNLVVSNYLSPVSRIGDKIVYYHCPVHDDKKASLRVNLKDNLWSCYPCGKWGDAVEFVRHVENVNHSEAVKIVVDICGLDGIEEDKSRARAIISERENADRMLGDIRYRLFNIESAIEKKLERLYSMATDRYEDILKGERILFDTKSLLDKSSHLSIDSIITLYNSGTDNEYYRFLIPNYSLEQKCEEYRRVDDVNRAVAFLSKREDCYDVIAAYIGGTPSIKKCAELLVNSPVDADKIINGLLDIIKVKAAASGKD